MKWFGPAPFSHACMSTPHAPTPLDYCAWCEEPFTEDDSGYLLPLVDRETVTELGYHVECHLRQIFGSVAHIERRCACYGGNGEDDPALTKREAARAAVAAFEKRGPR